MAPRRHWNHAPLASNSRGCRRTSAGARASSRVTGRCCLLAWMHGRCTPAIRLVGCWSSGMHAGLAL
eukprot:10794675-Lingulodinium_polyedra.AAC.1